MEGSPLQKPAFSIDLTKINHSESDNIDIAMENSDSNNDLLDIKPIGSSISALDVQASWESDRERLTEVMAESAQEVLNKLENVENSKPLNASEVFSYNNLQHVEKLAEQLKQYLNKVYAVDHTIYVMTKMCNICEVVFKMIKKPCDEQTTKEAEDCLEALELYLSSAICFLECLFDLTNLR